jgi:hypothetical protein
MSAKQRLYTLKTANIAAKLAKKSKNGKKKGRIIRYCNKKAVFLPKKLINIQWLERFCQIHFAKFTSILPLIT